MRSATTERRPDGNFRRRGGSHRMWNRETCLRIVPTWTTERVELLKSHFEAGLSCREIAASIGVSRNAVIGKLARLELTRGPGKGRTAPGQGRQGALPEIHSPAAVSDAAGRLRERTAAPARSRSPASAAARCSNSATNDAAGRSARPAPRISAFAATRRWKACPIARATTASPIVRARASASCADQTIGSREENASQREAVGSDSIRTDRL